MFPNKLNNLKLSLLLKELNLLEGEEEFNNQFIEHYKPLFMEEVLKLNESIPPQTGNTENRTSNKNPIIEVTKDEEIKIKHIFRNIVKICHPDKTEDQELIDLFSEAQKAYDENDLLTLYRISQKLNIEVDLDENNITLLKRIVEEKKKTIKNVEGSYLWLWVNSKTEEEKMNLIKMYVNQG
jgi:hypothetical protein